jgi:hypothetical protein
MYLFSEYSFIRSYSSSTNFFACLARQIDSDREC